MTDEDLKKIGDEFERVLNPVYEEFDTVNQRLGRIEKTLGHHSKILEEHTDKIDALTAEVHDIHLEIGAQRDKTDSEIENIKAHIGLAPNNP
jgi:predicted  nucleic acid-binding Zn-ribbon protein